MKERLTYAPSKFLTVIQSTLLITLVGVVYFLSNPAPNSPYDYTVRMARAFRNGDIGLQDPPPSWLNEMIPNNGEYFSAFPLGSIVSVLPFTFLEHQGPESTAPSKEIMICIAIGIAYFGLLLARHYAFSSLQQWVLVGFLMFGNWMWCNLAFASAWNIALGFCVLGQMAMLYFIFVKPSPFLSGICFAIAFGNRTETIILSPLIFYLLHRQSPSLRKTYDSISFFSIIPFVLGIATLAYNSLRFNSPFDFGYSHIPGVLEEAWYRDGIFSLSSVPRNFKEMLLSGWCLQNNFPHVLPTGFGGSIFLASPFLVFGFRSVSLHPYRWIVGWLAIISLTIVLWCHGNPGGWQYSYRYASILLPWIFLIFLETTPKRLDIVRPMVLLLSIGVNVYANYLFHFTDYIENSSCEIVLD